MRIIYKPMLEEDVGRCPVCGCVFAYTADDVWVKDVGPDAGKLFLDCPCCDRDVSTDTIEPVQPEELEEQDANN